MPGIPRELAEHALNVDPKARPVQQSMRRFSEPKRKAIGEEVNRLRKAGFIRELKEAEWVANPVMVPKKDTTALRMCIDYTSLNKHCPKDHFPLPRIDQIVDSTAGCDRLSFLDAYSGYNQIKLKKEDQELTAFITPHGVFCYNVMTFGLKNAGATYQRCMQACLGEQIGRNIEVYIDDIVVKTKHAATLIDDLRETFDNLDKYKIKLNPKKCFFGVPGGQVLGYFISARGIEANPLKIKAILDMEPPKNLHQVQQLAGRLAALSRFIAKLGEKALPFYSLMKKSEKFEWTDEAQESFDNLKKILSTSPVLVTPREKETLLMYIAATVQVFSSVLVVEREEAGRVHGVQRPVYYLSEVLTPAKQRYPHHQKLAYAVWRTARKLRHYFTEHPIIVVSEAPLKNILTNPEATGRVSQWAIEIAPHDITYVNRTAIKSQILPDFVADWIQSQTPAAPDMSGSWTMYFDGSKRSTGAGAGVILISPQGDKMKYILRMNFSLPTNNEAEYEALLHGMKMAKACGATRLEIYGDSNLVVQQSMNLCDAVSDNMIAYRQLYQNMEAKFEGCELKHIGRASNEEADALANIGSMCSPIPDGVFYEVITQRSIKEKVSAPPKSSADDSEASPQQTVEETPPRSAEQVLLLEPLWTKPFLAYLTEQQLPEDPVEARRIVRRSKAFTVVNGELYKRSISGIFQRCIAIDDGKALLREIHEGTCGHHAGSRALVAKAFRAGFYWPTAASDARDLVMKCDPCQRFAPKPHAPATDLMTIPLAWPFAQWGLDQVGPLPRSSPGGHTYLLVAVDKFTKWIEAVPVRNQKAETAVQFFRGITCRFGMPHSIVTDNGTNFDSKKFRKFCDDGGIKLKFASVAHPQTNGQVERINGLIGDGLKKRLTGAAGAWVEELPSVLWSLRTTPNRSTQYTPFFLVHGAEAVLPADVRFEAPRVTAYTEATSNIALQDAVDLLDEARDIALARTTVYQQALRNYHSRRIRNRSFNVGDMVLRLKQERPLKLESPWEGPFIITKVIPGGAYRLKNPASGKDVENPWNVAHLRRFYA